MRKHWVPFFVVAAHLVRASDAATGEEVRLAGTAAAAAGVAMDGPGVPRSAATPSHGGAPSLPVMHAQCGWK
jgi:hypothetical protein